MAELKTLARPYARAAYDFSASKGKTDEWMRAFAGLAEAVKLSVRMRSKLGQFAQAELLAKLCEPLPEGAENLLRLMARNHRLALLPECAQLFAELAQSDKKKAAAKVISAHSLDESQREALKKAMERRLGCEVDLNESGMSDLLGGAVVRSGSWVFENTVSNRVKQLARLICD